MIAYITRQRRFEFIWRALRRLTKFWKAHHIVTIFIAPTDWSISDCTPSNPKPFANAEKNPKRWFAYPRWTKDKAAIVYHASPSLYLYTLNDESTVKVSTRDGADYRYPHCEATPK